MIGIKLVTFLCKLTEFGDIGVFLNLEVEETRLIW